ncbi:MAG: NAD(P)/FAD-dependent oxidoreductase [Burkholderiales bacterium]
MSEQRQLHRIVIVGGGAGGLELATNIGDKLGKRKQAEITLVDKSPTHVWKPLLHQIAAGTSGLLEHELEYLAQAHWHHFRFLLGEMTGLDRADKQIQLAPILDDRGIEISAARSLQYDTLVLCVGSLANDFGTPGAKEHAIALESQYDAAKFHRRLINAFIRAHSRAPMISHKLNIAIIGAGATGVELAAELHYTTRQLAAYGLDKVIPDRDVRLTIIEAAARVLPALPERLSEAILQQLKKLNVQVLTGDPVVQVSIDGVDTKGGKHVPADLVVWAAGIKAPDFLASCDDIETTRNNQLVVKASLQTTRDDSIFAFGDCAACPWPEKGGNVPPRAQAAHQQAALLAENLKRRINGEPLKDYRYRDFGSLVSLGEYSTVGNLMGRLMGGSILIEGLFARFMYVSLYKLHLLALHGFGKTALDTVGRLIARRTQPQIKLH